MCGCTNPCFQAHTLTTAYLANQKPFQNATLDIFVAPEWGYGKYVMWPSKELLDYIQFRNKGALVQTDRNKDQTALPLCPCQHRAHSGPHLSFSQLDLLLTTL